MPELPTTPFTRRDLPTIGISPRQLSRGLADGDLIQPLRGVYVGAELPLDLPARAAAVALVLPDRAVLCRGTVAWLLGVGDVRGPGRPDVPASVECVVATGRTPVRRPGVRCYEAALPTSDVVQVQGLPCTSPARTAADLVRWLPRPMGLASLDAMAHLGLVRPWEVTEVLHRFVGGSGAAVARELVAVCEPLTESFGESWLRLRWLDAGFPRCEAQIWVDDAGRPRYRLDLGLREKRLGFEYDGEEHHSGRWAMARDQARLRRLSQLG